MVDGINGVSSTTDDEEISEEIADADLSDQQLEQLANRIEGLNGAQDIKELLNQPEELEGIANVQEVGRVRAARPQFVQRVRRAQAEEKREELIQQLENIEDNTELLRQIATLIANLNTTVESIGARIAAIQQGLQDVGLIIKDASSVTFDKAEDDRTLVQEDNIITSTILVDAKASNEGDLWIASSNIGLGNGLRVNAGQTVKLPVDISKFQLQIIAEEVGDQYSYLALGREV